eukprot:UN27924
MIIDQKILKLDELQELLGKEVKNKLVLCQGHFNVIHPGHVRFLRHAKSLGDILLVAIYADRFIEEKIRKSYYSQEDRLSGAASLEAVDYVILLDRVSIDQLIEAVKPEVYVLGKEFEKSSKR